jgi:hypothetical protein
MEENRSVLKIERKETLIGVNMKSKMELTQNQDHWRVIANAKLKLRVA